MPEYLCRGQEQLNHAAALIANLSPGKIWRVSVVAYKARRSGDQNNRFHKLIALLAQETGDSPKRLKEWVKAEFGPMVAVEVNGKVHEVPKPSHDYEVGEMSAVMDRLEAWCGSEMGVRLE